VVGSWALYSAAPADGPAQAIVQRLLGTQGETVSIAHSVAASGCFCWLLLLVRLVRLVSVVGSVDKQKPAKQVDSG
jgi:hypothetical protein